MARSRYYFTAAGAAVLIGGLATIAAISLMGSGEPDLAGGPSPSPTRTVGARTPAVPSPTPGSSSSILSPIEATVEVAHLTYDAPVPGIIGAYFLDVASGAIEAWTAPPELLPGNPLFSVSHDNRLVFMAQMLEGPSPIIVVDRSTRKQFAVPGNMRILDARGSLLMLAPSRPALPVELTLVDLDDMSVRAVPLPNTVEATVDAAFFVADTLTVATSTAGNSYWLDLERGTAAMIGQGTVQRLDDGRVALVDSPGDTVGIPIRQDGSLPNGAVDLNDWSELSPDGELVARTEMLGIGPFHLGAESLGMTTISDAVTGQPVFRVLSGLLPNSWGSVGSRWLADSSGLVLHTQDGYSVISREGAWIRTLPQVPYYGWPSPSPDNPEVFALGVVGIADYSTGVERLVIPRLEPYDALTTGMNPWGTTGEEMRFVVTGLGKGLSGAMPMLDPVVQRDPDGPPRLIIKGTGSCLHVRQGFGTATPSVGCYPDGAMAEVRPTHGPADDPADYAIYVADDGSEWIHLRLADGLEGWASALYLGWSP